MNRRIYKTASASFQQPYFYIIYLWKNDKIKKSAEFTLHSNRIYSEFWFNRLASANQRFDNIRIDHVGCSTTKSNVRHTEWRQSRIARRTFARIRIRNINDFMITAEHARRTFIRCRVEKMAQLWWSTEWILQRERRELREQWIRCTEGSRHKPNSEWHKIHNWFLFTNIT